MGCKTVGQRQSNYAEAKYGICNTCTRRLVYIAYERSPWFRLVREPLKFAMRCWVRLYQLDPNQYEVTLPSCRNCMRFYKTVLKENSRLFRLLNKLMNPVFDIVLERIVSEEEVKKAKAHARAATAGEALPCDGERYVKDPRWGNI